MYILSFSFIGEEPYSCTDTTIQCKLKCEMQGGLRDSSREHSADPRQEGQYRCTLFSQLPPSPPAAPSTLGVYSIKIYSDTLTLDGVKVHYFQASASILMILTAISKPLPSICRSKQQSLSYTILF